jgi:type II secretory pathway pseudopilin PulG
MTVLAVLSMGVIPMVKTAVKRQREQQLRDSLREMREAIKDFHRDALNSPYLDQAPGAPPGVPPAAGRAGQQGSRSRRRPPDPRTKVAIADKTLFGVDNPDRYPPKLETLVEGRERRGARAALGGGATANPGNLDSGACSPSRRRFTCARFPSIR